MNYRIRAWKANQKLWWIKNLIRWKNRDKVKNVKKPNKTMYSWSLWTKNFIANDNIIYILFIYLKSLNYLNIIEIYFIS